jgi:hypothetical protein
LTHAAVADNKSPLSPPDILRLSVFDGNLKLSAASWPRFRQSSLSSRSADCHG